MNIQNGINYALDCVYKPNECFRGKFLTIFKTANKQWNCESVKSNLTFRNIVS